MKRVKKIIVILIAVVLMFTIIGISAFFANEKQIVSGMFLRAANGEPMLIDVNGSVYTLTLEEADLCDDYNDGDTIIIVCGYFLETYPARTDVYFCWRTKKGNRSDLPDKTIESLEELGWLEENWKEN